MGRQGNHTTDQIGFGLNSIGFPRFDATFPSFKINSPLIQFAFPGLFRLLFVPIVVHLRGQTSNNYGQTKTQIWEMQTMSRECRAFTAPGFSFPKKTKMTRDNTITSPLI